MRTITRSVAVLATASATIGLLGALAPAGQASATHRASVTHRAPDRAGIPAGNHRMAGPFRATGPETSWAPAIPRPITGSITGLVKAPGGASLPGVCLTATGAAG